MTVDVLRREHAILTTERLAIDRRLGDLEGLIAVYAAVYAAVAPQQQTATAGQQPSEGK